MPKTKYRLSTSTSRAFTRSEIERSRLNSGPKIVFPRQSLRLDTTHIASFDTLGLEEEQLVLLGKRQDDSVACNARCITSKV